MRKLIYLISFCLLLSLVSVGGTLSAHAQIRITPSYGPQVRATLVQPLKTLRADLELQSEPLQKSVTWMAIIFKGVRGDTSISVYDETKTYYSWLFENANSEIILSSFNSLNKEFRTLPSSKGLDISANYLSKNKDKLTKPDLFMATYLLSYDFASFLQFEKQNQLYLTQLDFINQYEPTDRNLLLHLGAAYYGYGQVLLRKKRITDALEYFFKAEKLYKEGPNSTHNLYTVYSYIADSFIKNKDYTRSDYYIRKAILEFPKDRKDARIQLQGIFAESQLGLKDPETALAILKNAEATIKNPRNDYYLYFLEIYLDVLTELKDYSKALGKGNEALFLAQNLRNQEIQSRLNYKMGLIHARTANFSIAEKLIKDAIKNLFKIYGFNDVGAYAALAELYTIEGRFEEALEAKTKQIEAEKHQQQMINHDILADLESVAKLREEQTNENKQSNQPAPQQFNNGLNDEDILSFFSNVFILLLIGLIIRVFIIFRNSSKV